MESNVLKIEKAFLPVWASSALYSFSPVRVYAFLELVAPPGGVFFPPPSEDFPFSLP